MANISCDFPAEREWPSPIRANGAVMRRSAPKLEGDDITLTDEDGVLILNTTRISAHASGYERFRRGLPVRDLWLIGSKLTGWSSLKQAFTVRRTLSNCAARIAARSRASCPSQVESGTIT